MVVTVSPAYFPQSVASGDPRPDSMIFWTRVFDETAGGDYQVRLMVALDEALTDVVVSADLTAQAQFDGIAKLKLMQLSPYTTYYYQFQYQKGSQLLGSKVGRSRTAATASMDVPARFAVISCQDYRDRYYNVHAEIARQDLDFVVHLGDYIYETTGGSLANVPDSPEIRSVSFQNPEEAIDLGNALAANSLGNYRDLYKTFRSDSALQLVHERFPMIAIWDDHEFSNDSWKNNGTYFNGSVNEEDTPRKLNSERAYAEYMPLDFGLNNNGILVNGDEAYYPNTRIYRDFQFGKHLHLLLTDTRTFRPDHLIPEDAFPGTVVVEEAVLQAVMQSRGVPWQAVAANFAAYVNIDAPQLVVYKQVLTAVLTQELLGAGLSADIAGEKAAEKIQGNIATLVANAMIDAYNSANPNAPLPPLDEAGLPRGLAYVLVGKTSTISSIGARNFLLKTTFDLLAAITYQQSGGASEDVLGADQEAWLIESLTQSTATWRVLANSIPMASMLLDFSNYPVPPNFRNAFYVGVDHWDGFGNKRQELINRINAIAPRTVAVAGDIHSTQVTHHGEGFYEFTIAAVSSTTIKDLILDVSLQPPFNSIPGLSALVEQLDALLLAGHTRLEDGSAKLQYTNNDVHGFAVLEVTGAGIETTYHHIDQEHITSQLYDHPGLSALFEKLVFQLSTSGHLTSRVD